jgi:hypothetical protein
MPLPFWYNLPTMAGYLLIVLLACVSTAVTALFCSTVFQKTSTSLIATYLIIVTMFMAPVAASFFAKSFLAGSSSATVAETFGVFSPFSATFALPLDIPRGENTPDVPVTSNLRLFAGFIGWSLVYNSALVVLMTRLFQARWRVAE